MSRHPSSLTRRLAAGARVALIAPSGPLKPGDLDRAVANAKQLGWEPVVGSFVNSADGYFAGADTLRIDDFNMDMVPEGQMVIIENKDQPGMIGFIGTTFGTGNVNIADMVISRVFHKDGSAHALALLKVDSTPSAPLIDELRKNPGILRVKTAHLPTRDG